MGDTGWKWLARSGLSVGREGMRGREDKDEGKTDMSVESGVCPPHPTTPPGGTRPGLGLHPAVSPKTGTVYLSKKTALWWWNVASLDQRAWKLGGRWPV